MAPAVYRLFDERRSLLYVGVADDPSRRSAQHALSKPWWPEVAGHDLKWLEDRPSPLAREIDVIRAERSRYNVRQNLGDLSTTPLARINFDVPADLHRQIRMKASEGVTIADVGRRLLEEWLTS
jgi:predicted GIY-YIG superfamily endonuclease